MSVKYVMQSFIDQPNLEIIKKEKLRAHLL